MTLEPNGLMNPDYLELIRTMPRTSDGMVKDLHYVPKGQLDAYEKAWGEWCRNNKEKRKMWPVWLERWISERKKGD